MTDFQYNMSNKTDKEFYNANPKYVFIGVRHDGFRRIPAQYVVVTEVLNTEEELYDAIVKTDGMFKIFPIKHNYINVVEDIDEWRRKAKEYFDECAQKKELAEFERLKKKFEQ